MTREEVMRIAAEYQDFERLLANTPKQGEHDVAYSLLESRCQDKRDEFREACRQYLRDLGNDGAAKNNQVLSDQVNNHYDSK